MKQLGRGIIIRETAGEDLRQIYTLWNEEAAENARLAGITADELAESFASDSSIMLTASRKKRALGFIIGSIKDHSAVILWMLVIKKFRGTGIGSALYNRFNEKAACAGCNTLSLVLPEDSNALNFFSSRELEVKGKFVELHKAINGKE